MFNGLKINRSTIGRDGLAGLTAAIAAIPDGMASAVLAGVNPVFGLYNVIVGTPVAALFIGLVQAAGVSQGFANPDGKFPDPSTDFRGQGLANVAAGFFRGIPLGGSLSGTALVVNAGARSRWANIFTGVFVALGVLLFANLIQRLPMTALAAILIYAGYQTIKPERVRAVWRTNALSRTVMLLTFVATLFLPVQQAVFLGVGLQVILFVYSAAERMTIMELVPTENGDFREQLAPATLPDSQVTILLPYGSLFFGGAADFEEEAPSADEAQGAVVVLVLRGRQNLGSTFLNVLNRYAQALQKNGGMLILADVSGPVREQLVKTNTLEIIGAENVLPANPLLLASVQAAWAASQERLPGRPLSA